MSFQPECVISVFAPQLLAFAMMLTVTSTIIAATYTTSRHVNVYINRHVQGPVHIQGIVQSCN